jgi:hypothetical protein
MDLNYRHDDEVMDFWGRAAEALAAWMNEVLFPDRGETYDHAEVAMGYFGAFY